MKHRWLLRAAVVLGTFALLGGLALLGLQAYVRAEFQRRCAERGIQLLPGGVKFGFLYVALENSTFRTQARPALSGSVGSLRVEFEALSVERVIVSNVAAVGHFTRSELRAWVQRAEGREEPEHHGPSRGGPLIQGEHLSLALSEPTGSVPWLMLKEMAFEQRAALIMFDVPSVRLLGVDLGHLLGELSAERWVLHSKPKPGGGSFQGTASFGPEEITLDAQFASLPLASPLGGSAQVASSVSGAAHARFQRQVAGQPAGDVELTLEGMKAPKLGALGVGFFAERGFMRASWTLDPAYESLQFSSISFRAGKLGLSGSGRLEALAHEPRIVAALAGSLSCQEISSAFLNAQLGSWLGGLAAAPARQWIKGRVQVDLKLDAKLSSLANEPPRFTFGVGCGLAFPQ